MAYDKISYSKINKECAQPMLSLIRGVADMLVNKLKDLNPSGISKEMAYNLFEKNLIFLKSFGVFVFIVIALYRLYNYSEVDTLLNEYNFFIESVLYGLFIAVPFYILMRIRKTALSRTKIVCYATAVGVFFAMLNYIFEASGFMSFSFRNDNDIKINNYIVKDTDSRLIISKDVDRLVLPEDRKDILIITNEHSYSLISKVPIVSLGLYDAKNTIINNEEYYTYKVSENSVIKVSPEKSNDAIGNLNDVYTVSDYGLLSSLFPKSSRHLTAFEQFIEGYGFAAKFIIGALLMISFLILAVTLPLSQRDLDVRYKYNFGRKGSLTFFFIVETFILFGLIGSLPMIYMAYNRYPVGLNDFLKSEEDQHEFIKVFGINVLVMSIANIVFQTSGFYNHFLG